MTQNEILEYWRQIGSFLLKAVRLTVSFFSDCAWFEQAGWRYLQFFEESSAINLVYGQSATITLQLVILRSALAKLELEGRRRSDRRTAFKLLFSWLFLVNTQLSTFLSTAAKLQNNRENLLRWKAFV